jgi:hypothetical protein
VSEVPTHQNFLYRVGSSERFNCCEDFLGTFRYAYSPPVLLGITKILSAALDGGSTAIVTPTPGRVWIVVITDDTPAKAIP